MANREFFYFYAPTWDFPPDGPIKLGNVLKSLDKPERPICCYPPPSDPHSLLRTTKSDVHYTKEKLKSGKFSLLTKFLSVLGVGVDTSFEAQNSLEDSFVFKSIETTHSVPTPEYVQSCVNQESVVRYLAASRYRKPVYIITGIKVVTGVQASTLKSRTVGGSLDVNVDGTILTAGAVPIGGGPGVHGKVASKAGIEWKGSSDFVFAFRVSRVRVGKNTALVTREEDYSKGALMGDENEIPQNMQRLQQNILGIDQPDAQLEGYDVEELMDGDAKVYCAIPRERELDSDE